MRVIRSVGEMKQLAHSWRGGSRRVGLVPTMGALHAGHRSLMERSRRDSDITLVSLFVNPAQFGGDADFSVYPRSFEADTDVCKDVGADVLFAPPAKEIYASGFSTWLEVGELGSRFEGAARPGHFRAVATVVLKLFEITQPGFAVFGQKDAQQLAVIRRMVRDFDLPVAVVAAPTVRDSDGLAISSRNRLLTPEQRRQAPALYAALRRAADLQSRGEHRAQALRDSMMRALDDAPGLEAEYAEVVESEGFRALEEARAGALLIAAARLGKIRLIDNLPLGSEADGP